MQFVMHEVLGVTDVFKALPAHTEIDQDTVNQILEQAAKFAKEVVQPLNQNGDKQGCTRHPDGTVTTPDGFKQAYEQYVEAGWPALACNPEHGGQGLPVLLNTALYEMLNSANQAWTMYPGLSHGAYECLQAHGTPEQKTLYLEKLVSGEWLGTHVPDRTTMRHRSWHIKNQSRAASRW
jgi:alkylation response protein AidB-like acyl-CoA dehydrogenase